MLLVKEPARGAVETRSVTSSRPSIHLIARVLRIPTMWWIVLSGMLFNFNAYAVNAFQSPFLQRFHELGLKDASNVSAISLGLTGVIGLLLGGWLGDRMHLKRPNGRLLLAATCMLIAAPCVFMALQQPKGGVLAFTIFMGASSAMTFVYYSTVYSAIQDVVPPASARNGGVAVLLRHVRAGRGFRHHHHGRAERLLCASGDAGCGRRGDGAGVQGGGSALGDVRDSRR